MARGIKRQHGRPVCTTAYDARGRAHMRHPLGGGVTVCGRSLELAPAHPNGKSCGACAELAGAANAILRRYLA